VVLTAAARVHVAASAVEVVVSFFDDLHALIWVPGQEVTEINSKGGVTVSLPKSMGQGTVAGLSGPAHVGDSRPLLTWWGQLTALLHRDYVSCQTENLLAWLAVW